MRVCGVDEAGRGSFMGPMVIAGVTVRHRRIPELAKIGVRDSKTLSGPRREALYDRIIELADDYHIEKIRPRDIDRSVRRHRLNRLEARYMAKVIRILDPDKSYVDACDPDAERFGAEVSEMAGSSTVLSYHHADSTFAVVSAASILAKVTRDRAIKRLRAKHDLGSGYPSDKKTIRFALKYHRENGQLPAFARLSWRPARRIICI